MAGKSVSPKKKYKWDGSELFIPSGLFLGIGIGSLLGNIFAGTLIGIGVGFLGTATISSLKR